jgi:molybdopterin-guanine dinucleotide biosynthesis protein A
MIMNHQNMNYVYIAAGGPKKIDGHPVPLLPLGPEGKTLIEHTLDNIVKTDVDMVVIGAREYEAIRGMISSRTDEENDHKPIFVIHSRNGPGTNFLESLYQYTRVSEDKNYRQFSGDCASQADFKSYVENNPELRNIRVLVTSCDIPFASPNVINNAIASYIHDNTHEKIDFMALLAEKEHVEKDIRAITQNYPEFADDFFRMESTISNYFSISGRKARAANFFALNPFNAKPHSFEFEDDLYNGRFLSQLSSIPQLRYTVLKYAGSAEEALKIGKALFSVISSWPLNKLGFNAFGVSHEDMAVHLKQITGLNGKAAYSGDLSTMLDVDDRDTYFFLQKYFKELKSAFETRK